MGVFVSFPGKFIFAVWNWFIKMQGFKLILQQSFFFLGLFIVISLMLRAPTQKTRKARNPSRENPNPKILIQDPNPETASSNHRRWAII